MMPSQEQLNTAFGQLAKAPFDAAARAAAASAVEQVSDAEVLADLLEDHHLNLGVAEVIEPRLRAVGVAHTRAWKLVAEAMAMHATDAESRAKALRAIAHLKTLDAASSLDLELFVNSPTSGAPMEDVLALCDEYLRHSPLSYRAIAYKTTTLVLGERKAEALEFLNAKLQEVRDARPYPNAVADLEELISAIETNRYPSDRWP